MNTNSGLFSGETLPVAPKTQDPNIDAFNRKLLDYLRRLTAKLAGAIDVEGESVAAYVGTLSEDQTSVPYNDHFEVKWTQDIWLDTGFYQHSEVTNNEEITVRTEGLYVIAFDVEHTVDTTLDFWVELYINGGYRTVEFSYLLGLDPGLPGSMVVTIPMVEGTKFRIRGNRETDGTVTGSLYLPSTRISVLRIASNVHGGGRGTDEGGNGWDSAKSTYPSWASGASSP